MSIKDSLRNNKLGDLLVYLWHKLAPSVTIYKKIYGVKVGLDLNDSLVFLGFSSKHIEESEKFDLLLENVKGTVWDIGCNVGIFSLFAASKGNTVVSLDLSSKAVRLLKASAIKNNLSHKISVINRAFTLTPIKFQIPKDANVTNGVVQCDSGTDSITYSDMERTFGLPSLIKMDIEYGEVQFLKSLEFKEWIKMNRIPLLVELHEPEFWDLVWNDVPHTRFTGNHVFFNHNAIKH